jgi:peptidoglycan/xylan/chitin deacetylase (PgdA/CDA1 family)
MRLYRPWPIGTYLMPEARFRIETGEKVLYLTFDDGPDPLSTLSVLKIVEKYNIRSLFFCKGRSAERYPELIGRIKAGTHIIGNHGYDHLDGWTTSAERYVKDVKTAEPFTSDKFFRPPYGHLSPGQYRRLSRSFDIFLWDVMAYDFDNSFGCEKSLRILKEKIRPGSIIVLHDRPDSTVHVFLEEFIIYSLSRGFMFDVPVFRDKQAG